MNPSKSTTIDTPPSKVTPETDITTLLAEPAPRAWYRRPMLWLGFVLLLLTAIGLWYWQARRSANAAPSYITQTVTRGDLTLTVTANGTLQPTRSINIGSELSGTVLKVNVDVNDRIEQGQVLVELDPSKLHDQILRSRAAVTSAKAVVEQAAATVGETTANLGRLEEVAHLSGGKVPSKAELDVGRAALKRAIAGEAAAHAGVGDAQAALSTDEINLSKSSIRAPSGGMVLTRSVEPGNAVAASLQAVTLFTLAEDLRQLRLEVYVDEADVGTVQVDQEAKFTVSAYPSRLFPAKITRVGFGSTITDNVVTYLTYLDVDNSDLILRPGMTATATITAVKRTDVLLVPNTALRFAPAAVDSGKSAAKSGILSSLMPKRPGAGGNIPRQSAAVGASTSTARRVYVLRDGLAVPIALTPGISDGHLTEITDGDLQVGMQVIVDQKTAVAQ
jgi:HlyD family secretion protein